MLIGALGSSAFSDDCDGSTIRVIDIADIVINLQVEGRLIDLDLVKDVSLAICGALSTLVRADVRDHGLFTCVLRWGTVTALVAFFVRWRNSLAILR